LIVAVPELPRHPPDCPWWEYDRHPQRASVKQSIAAILSDLARGAADSVELSVDSRRSHNQTFQQVVPLECEYYAGHYRGENFRCLRFCSVGVDGDDRVGASPQSVAFHMGRLAVEIRSGVRVLDAQIAANSRDGLRCLVAVSARIFVAFLTIHPYANGNGHMARLIVWALMGRYGFWPKRWPVDPRPSPPYTDLITQCRSGNPQPLEECLLRSIVRN